MGLRRCPPDDYDALDDGCGGLGPRVEDDHVEALCRKGIGSRAARAAGAGDDGDGHGAHAVIPAVAEIDGGELALQGVVEHVQRELVGEHGIDEVACLAVERQGGRALRPGRCRDGARRGR